MTNISQVADRIGEHICKGAGLESEVKKICFGVEVIMVMSISILTIIALGGVLGIFRETLVVTLAAFLMKLIIGGPHLSGFLGCLTYSAALVCSGAWLGSIYKSWLNPKVTLLILLLDLLIIFAVKLAPSYRTFNSSQTLKRKGLALILLFVSIIIYLEQFNLLGAGALIGFSISILNISPVGTNFVKWLDRITKQGGAGQ